MQIGEFAKTGKAHRRETAAAADGYPTSKTEEASQPMLSRLGQCGTPVGDMAGSHDRSAQS
jgi:hypothetical protein